MSFGGVPRFDLTTVDGGLTAFAVVPASSGVWTSMAALGLAYLLTR